MSNLVKVFLFIFTVLVTAGLFYTVANFRPDKDLTEWMVLWAIVLYIASKFRPDPHDRK